MRLKLQHHQADSSGAPLLLSGRKIVNFVSQTETRGHSQQGRKPEIVLNASLDFWLIALRQHDPMIWEGRKEEHDGVMTASIPVFGLRLVDAWNGQKGPE